MATSSITPVCGKCGRPIRPTDAYDNITATPYSDVVIEVWHSACVTDVIAAGYAELADPS